MDKKENKHILLKISLSLILCLGMIYLYGSYIEPKEITVHEYKIKTDKITDNFKGFTIVHLSDIHYISNEDLSRLKTIVNKINEYNPDIVVITGDLLDKNSKINNNTSSLISEQLSKIEAVCGKYIISGDNDVSWDEWENIVKDGGFINLNNNSDTIYKKGFDNMLIAGVSSFSDKEDIINKNQKTENYLNSFETGGPIYKILLMHEGDYIKNFENNPYDLVLAGASMGGKVNVPFYGPLIKYTGSKNYIEGHYKINNNTIDMYVSNGIGTSTPVFRLFNKPSINVYRLTK